MISAHRLLKAAIVCFLILPHSFAYAQNPKNIILMIGDGMGPQQLGLLQLYARIVLRRPTAFEKLADRSEMALVLPVAAESLVADSGCTATTLASGVEALPGTLGLDATGAEVKTILEQAKLAGKSVGLISDTRITHATPAAFVSHIIDRDDEEEIALQIAASNADILLSGGAKYFDARLAGRSKSAKELALENKFKILTDAQQLSLLKQPSFESGTKFLGLFAPSMMDDAFTGAHSERPSELRAPSLDEMTSAALSALSKNPKGFFMMVEAGQIDWAGHANDAGWLLQEMMRAEKLVELLTTWQSAHPDTLLVVTADHETGGFGFSYRTTDIPPARPLPKQSPNAKWYKADANFGSAEVLLKLASQKKSLPRMFDEFKRLPTEQRTPATLSSLVENTVGYKISENQAAQFFEEANRISAKIVDFEAFYPKSELRLSAALARILSEQTGIVWATGTHTSTPVPLFAVGPGKERFHGLKDQAQTGRNLIDLVH